MPTGSVIEKYELLESELRVEFSDGKKDSININDIIRVEESGDTTNLHIIKRLKTNKWTKKTLKISEHKDTRQKFTQNLSSKLQAIKSRPRSLLVLLNPIAGWQKGDSIYEKVIAPLFELAEIKVDTKVTEKHEDILEILASYPLESVDGIAVCGGDGSFGQCVNGMFKRTQKAQNIDYDDQNAKLSRTTVPIGHIPTGSYNLSSKFCYGCVDIETAVLTIITGSTSRLGMVNVYADNKWIAGTCLGVGHGFLSEFAVYVDQFRWMKTARILTMLPYYMLFKTRPCIEATVKILQRDDQLSEDLIEETLEGTYLDIQMGCHDTFKKDHFIGSPDWFSDHAVLYLFSKHCTIKRLSWDYIKRFFKGDKQVDPELLKEMNVIGYKVKILSSNIDHGSEDRRPLYYLTLHGEKLEITSSEWEVRLSAPIVTVFSGLA